MNKKLYVGNLSSRVTEGDLKDLFGEFGAVTEVKIVNDRFTGKPRGFGFVEFRSSEDASKAIQSLNGKRFQDRELIVNEARPRKNRKFRRH